jgi:AraC family transcriptional regulator
MGCLAKRAGNQDDRHLLGQPGLRPVNKLRSAACVEIPEGFAIANTNGLPIQEGTIAGGEYAVTRYVGPYEGLGPVWSNFTNYIEQTLRRRISSNPAFEVYVNDPSNTPPNELITELYMPVA